MISIGCHFRGPEQPSSTVGRLLLAASRLVQTYRGDYESYPGLRLNVVFCVPGSLGDFPDLNEIAAGRFSRKRKMLLVEVPVPRALAEAGGSVQFVLDSLRQANAIAAEVFARKGTEPFDLERANAIVSQVGIALAAMQQ